jgi:hypothetical protein
MQDTEYGKDVRGKKGSRDSRQRAAGPVRQQVERAREKWTDVERRIRQRMRIFPQKLRGAITARTRQEQEIDESDLRLPPGGSEPLHDPEAERTQRKPIVSVHGRDVEEAESEHPRAS